MRYPLTHAALAKTLCFRALIERLMGVTKFYLPILRLLLPILHFALWILGQSMSYIKSV